MDELLQKVAELRGMPASLVERSAKAKAEKTGTTVEAVLTEWAGESAVDTPQAAPEKAEVAPVAESTEPAAEKAPPTQPAVTTDYLVQLAADAKRMPPRLILSSATSRSSHSGASLHEVLADWAGVDLDELEANAAAGAEEPSSPEPESDPTEAPTPTVAEPVDVAPAVAAGAAALTMDQLLEKVSEVKGMPASLAQRSAQARAKKTGEPLEAVLAEWAGIEVGTVADAPSEAAPSAMPTEPTPTVASEERDTDEVVVSDDIEIIEAAPLDISDVPDTDDEPPAKRGGYPVWLAAAFVLIPLLAVGYILMSPNGPDCGSGGQLAVDSVTGVAMNCDGSAYGETVVDHLDAGGSVYQQCVACHNADGSGGVGPAFTGGAVLATFPPGSCVDHADWIAAGTAGWPDPTYGANEQTVGAIGLMPAFGGSLTEEQIAQVALYERVQFGGQDLVEAQADCGLVEEGVEASAEG